MGKTVTNECQRRTLLCAVPGGAPADGICELRRDYFFRPHEGHEVLISVDGGSGSMSSGTLVAKVAKGTPDSIEFPSPRNTKS